MGVLQGHLIFMRSSTPYLLAHLISGLGKYGPCKKVYRQKVDVAWATAGNRLVVVGKKSGHSAHIKFYSIVDWIPTKARSGT